MSGIIRKVIEEVWNQKNPALLDDEFSAGDRNVVCYTFSGTHDGELMGVAPTGKRVSISGISISRLVGGKVAEEWPVWDQMGVMQQIGAVS